MVHFLFCLSLGSLCHIFYVPLVSFLLQAVALCTVHSRYYLYVRVVGCVVEYLWFCLSRSQLQIDTLVEEIKRSDCKAATVLYKHFRLQSSLQRTQKDFNVIISFALAYHAVDLIVFSFAYFSSAFGSGYPIWQYIGTLMFDLVSIIFKLYPPAIVAAAVHRIVVQASKRCQLNVTPLTTDLPIEDMQLFQYIALCESDMGLKILGIRITVELSLKILMTIITATISFVVFVLPRL